jgi:resuscitation-promoting factor RpfB
MQLPPPPIKRKSSIGRIATKWAASHKLLSGVIGVLLVATSVNAFASDSDIAARPPAEQSPSVMSSPEPTIAPEPEVPTTKVPQVVGLSLEQARQRATARALDISVDRKYSDEQAGTVLSQSVRAGKRVEEGTSIELLIAKPFPRVPGLAGQKSKSAKQKLRQAGFSVVVQLLESSSTSAGIVIYSTPAAGTQVKPGATITIVVAKAPPPPPPPPPTPTSNCHPSYTGACLDPSASDYDCAGGSGDGPKYTGFVHVVGYDEYGLDADNDGLGCES